MAPYSSTLGWKIPWMEDPGRLQSMGSLRVDLGGTRRVGGLLGVAGRLSGTVSPFRAEQGTQSYPTRSNPMDCSLPGSSIHGIFQARVLEWSLSLFTFMHWRRKWQPTPVFLPGEFQGWGNVVGCRLWGHTESDTTEVT